MSQLKSLGPLDFDYERFPGVALRATDEKLPGHELADRPLQVWELAKAVATLAGHFLLLIFRPSLLPSTIVVEVRDELKALFVALERLEMQLGVFSPHSTSEVHQASMSRDLADAAAAAFAALLDLLFLLLDKWKSPKSLHWYRDLFDELTIPEPRAVKDFLDRKDRNRVFASWWVQGNNPLCVSAVRLSDIEDKVGRLDPQKYRLIVENDTPQEADAGGRLFWVDFPMLLDGLEAGDFPVQKRLPLPVVLFAVKPTFPDDEPFVPLAIFDESRPEHDQLVWSDEASPGTRNAWTRAMLASLCANQLHHTFISHFPRTHFVMEGMAVATLRTLPTDHDLYWLLRTHIDGTLGFNQTALSSFTTQSGADRFLMASSLRSGQKLMRESLDGWKKFDFPTDITQRQVDQLPYYPYREDAQLWWNAIAAFVAEVVDAAYTDDAAVMADTALQEWGCVLAGERKPEENGAGLIAAAPKTKKELHSLLQKIIFTCTAYHAAVQIPLNGFDVSPLTAPCSLFPDDAADQPESMLASLGTSLFQLAFFYFGDIITYRVGTYTLETKDIPNQMQVSVERFATVTLPTIADHISQANRKRLKKVGAYETLLPKNVSRSVDI